MLPIRRRPWLPLVLSLLLALAAWTPAVPTGPATAPPAFPALDVGGVPFLDARGQAEYARFLTVNLPRAFAVSPDGRFGWGGNLGSAARAREAALENCRRMGGAEKQGGCALYAEDLDVVWPGRASHTPPPPGPISESWNDAFVPDARFYWRGPQAAAGVLVWAHGKGAMGQDYRGVQPPELVRWFNNAGFDVVRFDRHPNADATDRAADWLRDGIAELRRRGYRSVVAAGQSRGAWNGLQMLDTAGLADVVIAISPAAQGRGGSPNLSAQADELRRIVDAAAPGRTRLAFVQFRDDPFIGDADTRQALIERLRPRLGALLLIDRPEGFAGHGAAGGMRFNDRFGKCLLRFATAAAPPGAC